MLFCPVINVIYVKYYDHLFTHLGQNMCVAPPPKHLDFAVNLTYFQIFFCSFQANMPRTWNLDVDQRNREADATNATPTHKRMASRELGHEIKRPFGA